MVGYKLDHAITRNLKSNSPVRVAIKLNLARTESITAISPEPLVTAERLQQALQSSGVGFNDSSLIAPARTTAETTAILAPIFCQAKFTATKSRALINIKQISTSLMI